MDLPVNMGNGVRKKKHHIFKSFFNGDQHLFAILAGRKGIFSQV